MLLSGQREGTSLPHYSNGDTIEGILAIVRPSGVLALELKVCLVVCLARLIIEHKVFVLIAGRGSNPYRRNCWCRLDNDQSRRRQVLVCIQIPPEADMARFLL